MFRPNRIGTPIIHENGITVSTLDITPQMTAISLPALEANVINSAPLGEFGYTALTWSKPTTFSIPAGDRCAFGQQFTINEPQSGDVSGVELNFAIDSPFPSQLVLTPFFCRIATAGTTLLDNVVADGPQTRLSNNTAVNNVEAVRAYQTQVIVRRSPNLQGTYLHGYYISNPQAVAVALQHFHFQASVRQLNDQQTIGYRDTLR